MRQLVVLSLSAFTLSPALAQSSGSTPPWNSAPTGSITLKMALAKAQALNNGRHCRDHARLGLLPLTPETSASGKQQLRQEVLTRLKKAFDKKNTTYTINYDHDLFWGWTTGKGSSKQSFLFSFINQAGVWDFECPF